MTLTLITALLVLILIRVVRKSGEAIEELKK